jgi:MoaA/NifB/PqqE/SkfB family radical SAM enzyme
MSVERLERVGIRGGERMAKNACIVPWSMLAVGPDGRMTFCCDVTKPLVVDGRDASVYRDSIETVWNAAELVAVRTEMARGGRPEACASCWKREDAGGVSRRLLLNEAYSNMGGELELATLPQRGADTAFRLEGRPDWFILELGNVCNLKCRTCHPLFSSRIAQDPVHSAWALGGSDAKNGATRLSLKPDNTPAWFQDVGAMADMVAGSGNGNGNGNAILSLMGGEPFLIKNTWRLLRALVERGEAHRFLVGLATNGQQQSRELAELAPHFRGFGLSVSVDGHGRLYEYLRHGANWATLVDNLRWYREVAKVHVSVVPTFQNGNALDIVTLLHFLDEQGLNVSYNVVVDPPYLRPANLPPSVRAIAAERIRSYLDSECRPENVEVVRSYWDALQMAGDDFDPALFEKFMTFTNDLDADRAESIAEAAPDLVALARAAGIEWSDSRRHASSSSSV